LECRGRWRRKERRSKRTLHHANAGHLAIRVNADSIKTSSQTYNHWINSAED
jgi:hypothetical protein